NDAGSGAQVLLIADGLPESVNPVAYGSSGNRCRLVLTGRHRLQQPPELAIQVGPDDLHPQWWTPERIERFAVHTAFLAGGERYGRGEASAVAIAVGDEHAARLGGSFFTVRRRRGCRRHARSRTRTQVSTEGQPREAFPDTDLPPVRARAQGDQTLADGRPDVVARVYFTIRHESPPKVHHFTTTDPQHSCSERRAPRADRGSPSTTRIVPLGLRSYPGTEQPVASRSATFRTPYVHGPVLPRFSGIHRGLFGRVPSGFQPKTVSSPIDSSTSVQGPPVSVRPPLLRESA